MKVYVLYPGSLETISGGYIYDRRIIDSLQKQGMDVHHFSLGKGFPFPDPATLQATTHIVDKIDPGSCVVIDGLAFSVLDTDLLEKLSRSHHLIALVHHPLYMETGLSEAQSKMLYSKERKALSYATGIIVTSDTTRKTLIRDFGRKLEQMHVVCPGNDPAPLAKGSLPPLFLTVAALIARKGHLALLDALADISDLDWRWSVVGNDRADPSLTAKLQRRIHRHGLDDRIDICGEVTQSELFEIYQRADCFVLPSFHEGYGMAFSEALVRGLPVISTTAGAIPQTVPQDAAVLVEPGDTQALASALRAFLEDSDLRQTLQKAAMKYRNAFPTWQQSAAHFAAALNSICNKRKDIK